MINCADGTQKTANTDGSGFFQNNECPAGETTVNQIIFKGVTISIAEIKITVTVGTINEFGTMGVDRELLRRLKCYNGI
jgi:hypothetical protein